ncbi:hypothetical protein MP638_001034 [Amoeboaphelidium occidentale]|nr:hypothetical protein MP638_001034 [Amoeboaphelidium occidentale]
MKPILVDVEKTPNMPYFSFYAPSYLQDGGSAFFGISGRSETPNYEQEGPEEQLVGSTASEVQRNLRQLCKQIGLEFDGANMYVNMNNASPEGCSLAFLSFLEEETDNTGLFIIQSGVKRYVKLPDDGYFIAFSGNEFPKDLGAKPLVHGVDGEVLERLMENKYEFSAFFYTNSYKKLDDDDVWIAESENETELERIGREIGDAFASSAYDLTSFSDIINDVLQEAVRGVSVLLLLRVIESQPLLE